MRATLHIVTAAAFNTWLAEHGYSPSTQAASVQTTGAPTRQTAAVSDWTRYAPLTGAQTASKEGTQ
jgi:hypothetical protein